MPIPAAAMAVGGALANYLMRPGTPNQPNQLRDFNIAPVQQAPMLQSGGQRMPQQPQGAPQMPAGYGSSPNLQAAIQRYLGQTKAPSGVGRYLQGRGGM